MKFEENFFRCEEPLRCRDKCGYTKCPSYKNIQIKKIEIRLLGFEIKRNLVRQFSSGISLGHSKWHILIKSSVFGLNLTYYNEAWYSKIGEK